MKKVDIKGVVVENQDKQIYGWLGLDAVCPREVNAALEAAKGEAVEVHINSPGGSVFAGAEIYTALCEYDGQVTTKIVGVAASMASVIAMAGKCFISPVGQMMIHNVQGCADGDWRDMNHMSQVLQGMDETIINAYTIKSGMSRQQLLDMMNQEAWLTPQKALELKLVDGILFQETGAALLQPVAALSGGMVPGETIKKIRNLLRNPPAGSGKGDFLLLEARAKLKLIKLGGVGNE